MFYMEGNAMKMKLVEKPTVEFKNDVAVIIFPSRPYWFSATKEIERVLDVLNTEIDKDTAVKDISKNLSITSAEATETLEEVQKLLYGNGVLYINGKTFESSKQIEPSFQLNAIENVLVIATTQGCNLSCPHCYANAHKSFSNEMNTLELKGLVDDLEAMSWKNKVSRVGLTGGEFFMRPDALQIVDDIYRRGFRVLISSNGLLLNNKDIKKLARYKNLKISISLDGSNAEAHELIRGHRTFNRTIKTIKKLIQSGIFVGINMFVHRGNLHLIGETLCLVKTLGASAFNCLNLMHVGRANSVQCRHKLIRVSEIELNHELFTILRDNSHYQKLMENSTFANQIMGIAAGIKSHYCGIGTNRALYVRADGNVYPCPDAALSKFCLGNIRKNRLQDIWEDSLLLKELRQIDVDKMNPICAKCDVRYFCGGGCRGENYQVTRELYSPHFNCKEIRRTIIEMMWMLTEKPDFFKNKVKNLYNKICL
jgi:radical SAM protein with 4Fe4S-binding SPASM domain